MQTSRSTYGNAPKSSKRTHTQNHWIRYEELTRRYLPLLGGTVWATYTVLFTFRNRKTNQCFPRYQTIAESRGVSRRTVIRHINVLVAYKLIEKSPRFYDDEKKRECGGQRSNTYWFVSVPPLPQQTNVTPGVSETNPRTRSSPNQIDIKNLEEEKPPPDTACEHPWGEPLGYPHQGCWRCSVCGEIYRR
jgi:hypothetical protein